MNNRYLRELRCQLRCSRKVKNRLLEQFTAYQQRAIDEALDYDQMVTLFGPPEEMAQTLMVEITRKEQDTFIRNKLIQKIVAIFMVVSFVCFSLYILFVKEITTIEVDSYTHVYEEYRTPAETEENP